MSVDAHTRLVGLLGHPVGHSRSPLIHNTAFRVQRINAVYVALPVLPEQLADAVAGLRAMQFLGANVTIPHKQAVLPFLDRCSRRAEAVGAVNTIVCQQPEDGGPIQLYGDNTDVRGFLAPLLPHADLLEGTEMLIFGNGGAARAVAYGLLTTFRPRRVTLAARTPQHAEPLVHDLAAYDETDALRIVQIADAGPLVRRSQLLVNATPLGMTPNVEATPWPFPEDFQDGQLVYDLVYEPRHTLFLQDAAVRGATAIGGLEMLIGQASAAYRQWIDQPMPEEAVRQALREG